MQEGHDRTSSALAGDRRVVVAGPEDDGERLDRTLARRLPEFSRSRLKQLIEGGFVQAGAATITNPSQRVKPGERFALLVPPAVEAAPAPQARDLDIRYEDQDIIVINKPAGLVVHPAPGNPDHTLVNALLAHCGDSLAGIGGVRRPGIVHRLDKDTSGLMVIAKTEAALARLAEEFAARRIERAYQAVVWGVPQPAAGEIVGNIGRSPVNRKKMAVLARGGKEAITRYRVVRAFAGRAALLECRLATGRTHQIRVHLAAKGHPLIGDPQYGNRSGGARRRALPAETAAAIGAFPRQALHAGRLGFGHPRTGDQLSFSSNLPSDMTELLVLLEGL